MNKADLSPHLSEWRDRWAVGVSHTLSPAGVATLVLAAMALRSPDGAPVPLWGALVGIAVYALVPAAVLLVLARRSGAADVFDPSKAVRRRMLLAGTICYLMGYGVIEIVGLGSGMRWVGATFAAGAAAVWAIDRGWKISIHNTGAGGGAVLLLELSPELWPFWGLLPLVVGWARWQRGAHDLAQLAAGAALGGGLAWFLRGYYQ